MSISVLRGRYVITAVHDGHADVLEHGAVAYDGDRILEIGKSDDVARHHPDAVTLGSDEILVLPGLVNSHHHVGLTPFQLGSADAPLEVWIGSRLGARRVDPYLDTLYSAIELLSSGVTTVQHLQGRLFSPASAWAATDDAVLTAYADSGLRVSYSAGIRDQSALAYAPDEELVRLAAPDMQPLLRGYLADTAVPVEQQLEEGFHSLRSRWDGAVGDLVRIQLAPTNLHWLSDRALALVRDASEATGAGMHMHLLETPYQAEYARRRDPAGAVAHLAGLGLLSQRLTLGHGVWLSDDELQVLAAADVSLCHNASSNLRLRSGIAPITAALDHGVCVAIGLDEAGINDDRDMLQELRVVMAVHGTPGLRARTLRADDVLHMATSGGAQTTPFGEMIGRLEPGRAADLVALDWSALSSPYLDEAVPVVDAVLRRGKAQHVRHVVIAGRTVVRDGRLTTIDRERVYRDLGRLLAVPQTAAEEERRTLAAGLRLALASFYDSWPEPRCTNPFYSFNSEDWARRSTCGP